MTARLAGTVITVLSGLLLGFVLQATVLSGLQHDRAQQLRYAQFRADLARGEAPVGQTDALTGELHELGSSMAILEIPALAVREVVLEGTSASVLANGPGHRRDTPLPGQPGTSVVMGRQALYGGPFRNLPALVKGDTINVVTGQGTHEFRVLGVRRAGDPEPPAPARDAGRLVLITADGTPFAPTGTVWVDADLISAVQRAPGRPLNARALPAIERPMASEPAAWLGIALWGQMLLLGMLGLAWARVAWGGWQAWVVGVPVLGVLGLAISDTLARLLPNLM